MKDYWVRSTHPVDVSPSGRMVAPGEHTGPLDPKVPHNAGLIEAGVLVESEKQEAPPREELLKRAGALDITGRHDMNVEQLQTAIAEAEAAAADNDDGED